MGTIDKPCLFLPSHYIQLFMHAAFSLYTARDANFCSLPATRETECLWAIYSRETNFSLYTAETECLWAIYSREADYPFTIYCRETECLLTVYIEERQATFSLYTAERQTTFSLYTAERQATFSLNTARDTECVFISLTNSGSHCCYYCFMCSLLACRLAGTSIGNCLQS